VKGAAPVAPLVPAGKPVFVTARGTPVPPGGGVPVAVAPTAKGAATGLVAPAAKGAAPAAESEAAEEAEVEEKKGEGDAKEGEGEEAAKEGEGEAEAAKEEEKEDEPVDLGIEFIEGKLPGGDDE